MKSETQVRFNLYLKLNNHFEELNSDTAFYFANQAYLIALENGQVLSMANAVISKGYQLLSKGNFAESYQIFLRGKHILEDPRCEQNSWYLGHNSTLNYRLATLAKLYNNLGLLMGYTYNFPESIRYYKKSIDFREQTDDSLRSYVALSNLSFSYLQTNRLDSALQSAKRSLEVVNYYRNNQNLIGWTLANLGNVYLRKSDFSNAKEYYLEAESLSIEQSNLGSLAWAYFGLTELYMTTNEIDSSLYYGRKALIALNNLGFSTF